MLIARHIARLRKKVGSDLLLLPSVAVLPMDLNGRVLLVRQTDFGSFGTIGGAVDEDESPLQAAHREALEEIGVRVEILRILGALGGPQFRLTYPNGDQTAYVTTVYEARLPGSSTPRPDGDEVDLARWFGRDELDASEIGDFATATFRELGWLR